MERNGPCLCGSGKKYEQCCMQLTSTSASAGEVSKAMQAALEHHRAGRLPQAETLYRQVLRLAPDHADALYHLGVIAYQVDRSESAVELIGKAIGANPSESAYHNVLGLAFQKQGKLNEAVSCYRKALALEANSAEVHYNLGGALLQQGMVDEAVASYGQALSSRPDYAEAHNNLGVALLQQGKPDVAAVSHRQALSLNPDHAEAHNNLGMALRTLGKLDEALASYRQAVLLKPDFTQAHYNLGNAFLQGGKLDEALASYRQALSLKPDFTEAHYNLGNALMRRGQLDEAVASYRRALSFKPNHAEAHNNLGFALQQCGRLEEAIAGYREATLLKADYHEAHSNLLFATYSCPAESPANLMAECERYAARFEAPLRAEWGQHRNNREPTRRLKVGYVSPDFRSHAVAYFIEPILANHDRDEMEVFCYYNHAQHDEFTDRLAGYADRWLDCRPMTDEELAGRIRADGIDILIDLAGHTAGNRMLVFARKPAPVQITYLGCPGASTGLAAMDYRLTDACADPADSEFYYTEKLLRLRDSMYCYRPMQEAAEILTLPARQNGYVTFGSFSAFSKLSNACIELWAQLLREVPNSRLLVLAVPEGESRGRLTDQFTAHGVPAERLEFHGRLSPGEFLRMFQRADVALDPFPVSGGTTPCESLWMGVPLISLVGTRCMSRMAFSVLSAVGLQDLCAATPEQYVRIAVKLAGDLPRLEVLHAGLRARVASSPLMDGVKFTRNLEKIYREIWTEWCGRAPS